MFIKTKTSNPNIRQKLVRLVEYEFEKLDTDQNGTLSKDEFAKLDVLNKRLTIQDADAKRNLERKLVSMQLWFGAHLL